VRVRYYGREVPVGCDEVALLDLSSLGILWWGQFGGRSRRRNLSPATTDLVVARPYESIVPKVAADVSRDDLSVDAILGHEVLVRTSRGLLGAPIAISLSISSRHDEKSRGKLLQEERKKSRNEEEGCRSRTPRQPGDGVGSTRSGGKRGKKKAWERSNVVTGAAGEPRRNSPGGVGRPVQFSDNGECKGKCATERQLGRQAGLARLAGLDKTAGCGPAVSELASLTMQMREDRREDERRVGSGRRKDAATQPCRRFRFGAGLTPL